MEFTLRGLEPLHLDRPVAHLSWHEAEAFARWSGGRLPTETEWEHAAETTGARDERSLDTPATRTLHPDARLGADWFGRCWQWTRSDLAPYPGYQRPTGAFGEYNGKFMCGQYVLRGSSCLTSPGHASTWTRNFFGPSTRWQVTGLRLARDA